MRGAQVIGAETPLAGGYIIVPNSRYCRDCSRVPTIVTYYNCKCTKDTHILSDEGIFLTG